MCQILAPSPSVASLTPRRAVQLPGYLVFNRHMTDENAVFNRLVTDEIVIFNRHMTDEIVVFNRHKLVGAGQDCWRFEA